MRLTEAIEKGRRSIENIKKNGWIKPWSIWIDGKKIEVVTKEQAEDHRKWIQKKFQKP